MAADKTIRQIIKTMEDAIEGFQKGIPAIQKKAFNAILDELKELETDRGRLLNSVQNLKKIGQLKNKLERFIIDQGYTESVKKFVEAFNIVEGLQVNYFAAFNQKFKPSKTLPIIKQLSIDKTINGLLGQGLQAAIVDRVGDIIIQSATSGGSYASLTEQLREHLTKTETDGSLERHTRTITTDALNQFAAQYQDTVAQDLELNWGRYVGSNITTTREFCELLSEKEWVHRKELPEIVKGNIDGHSCKLSKSTGLPLGMIPGTDASNFKIRRGGYNCGHQFFWVPDAAVPENVRKNIGKPAKQKINYDIEVLNKNGFERIKADPVRLKKVKAVKSALSLDEKVAVNGYSGIEYHSLNKFLRGKYTGDKGEYYKNYREILNDAIGKIEPPITATVFRGTDLTETDLKKYRAAFEGDGIVKEDAFLSTSQSISGAFGGNTRFMIKSKSGKSIKVYSEHPDEDEILFQAGLSYRIVAMDTKDDVTYIKMEEL